MLQAFTQHLTSEKRLSPHTTLAYKTDLSQCATYLSALGTDLTLETATHHNLRAWIVVLSQQGLSNCSINRKIASLKAFYKFLYNQEIVSQDPSAHLKRLKSKRTLPIFLQEKELIKLLDHHQFEASFEGWRDKLVLELLYGTGIRLAELLSLTDQSVDCYNGTLRVLGKRNKERTIPFPKSLQTVIDQYRTYRDEKLPRTTDLLLVTGKGSPCYPMLIYRIVSQCLRTYTNTDRYSPHVLRHTFATHLLNRGADLNAIKDLLGHESLTATQLYTHHSFKKLQEVFKQAHPRA